LKRFKENQILRDKKEIIINKIKEGVKQKFKEEDKTAPAIEFINQGSYAVDLGIKPEDNDYDIDVGAVFDLYKEDYEDPTTIKKWVKDTMENYTT
jgi:hypothetical protein